MTRAVQRRRASLGVRFLGFLPDAGNHVIGGSAGLLTEPIVKHSQGRQSLILVCYFGGENSVHRRVSHPVAMLSKKPEGLAAQGADA